MPKINLQILNRTEIKRESLDKFKLTLIGHRTKDHNYDDEETEIVLHLDNWDMRIIADKFWEKVDGDKKQFDDQHSIDVDALQGNNR